MSQVDFTLEDLKDVFATKDNVREIVREELVPVKSEAWQLRQEVVAVNGKLQEVKEMLEGGAVAESERLNKVDKRSFRTQRLLTRHIADPMAHTGGHK